MATRSDHASPAAAAVWRLAERQHGVVSRSQLLELGFGPAAIRHRLSTRRLHLVRRGVYALGRPELTRRGVWMAAVLSCGDTAVLSHESAAQLLEIRAAERQVIEVTIPAAGPRRVPGVGAHRSPLAPADVTRRHGIPATAPIRTLVDLALRLTDSELQTAISEADKRDLVDPETLRAALDGLAGRPGVVTLRRVLDRATFTLTDSELERRFLPIARSAGLGRPQTGRRLNGFKVDFHWPELGLVVETDGLRYHRTPAQQVRDRLRDQVHTAAGLTTLRFTHSQVTQEPGHVRATLATVARRLREPGGPESSAAMRSG